MSEREPGSAPKPRPPKENYDDSLERLEAAFAEPAVVVEQPVVSVSSKLAETVVPAEAVHPVVIESTEPKAELDEKPAFNFVDKRNAASQAWSAEDKEAAQAKLDQELEAVESLAVEDPNETENAAVPVIEATASAETEAPAPKRGESHHRDYHAQHPSEGKRPTKTEQPSEGIYRDKNNRYHNTNASGFATKADYEAQTGIREFANGPDGIEVSAQKHYDEVMGLNEAQPATPERPAYEKMDIDQLAFASAKAAMIGDKFVTDEIRTVYVTALEEAYTQPGSEVTHEEFEAGVDRFDRLVEAATDYEKAKDPDHSALVDAAVARVENGPTLGEKLKKWWGKRAESIKNVFRPEYWGERFTAAGLKIQEASTKALNIGVNEEDTDQEKDKKRNRNRVLLIAGGAAVAVAGLAAAYGIGFAVGNGGHHAAEAVGAGSGAKGLGGGDTLSQHDQSIANALNPNHGSEGIPVVADRVEGQEAAAAAAAAAAANKAQETARQAAEALSANYNIPSGEGGLELFNNLNIDPAKWAGNADSLLAKFPQDFYRMDGGGVGIAHSGLLSQDAQNAIEALR